MDILATPWGFASTVVLSGTILALVWRVGHVSLSKAGIVIGKNTTKPVSPHATCPHAGDIVDIVQKTTEYAEKRQELKAELLTDQMRFYEETEEEVIGTLKALFLSLLSDKVGKDISYVQHPEYIAYTATLKAISADVKDYIRETFRANHYAEKTPDEQQAYVNKKETVVTQKVTEALNSFWRGQVVTREELYKVHHKRMDGFQAFVTEVYNQAFTLSREYAKEVERLEKSYRDYIAERLGR